MAELTKKQVVRLTDTQKEFLDSQGNGSEFIRSKINEESISEKVLNVASDIHEEISQGTDNPNTVSFNYLVNECGEFSFDCMIHLKLEYTPAEPENDLGYSLDVIKAVIDINEVYDEDGNSVKVLKTALRKLEKTLEQNLTFEIYRL